jgi:hypothetical protein
MYTEKEIEAMKKNKKGLFAEQKIKKMIIRWALCIKSRQLPDDRIHRYHEVNEDIIKDVFSLAKYDGLIRDIKGWWKDDLRERKVFDENTRVAEYADGRMTDLKKRSKKVQDDAVLNNKIASGPMVRKSLEAYFPFDEKKRFIDTKDSSKYFKLASDEYLNVSSEFVIDSPLGKEGEMQVYYWDFSDPNKFNYVVNFTKTQIQGIRWDSKRNAFIGMEKDPTSKNYHHVELPESWVKENFDKKILSSIIAYEENQLKKVKFFRVPLADPNEKLDSFTVNPMNPEIKYKQGLEKTCCFDALCSALYALNWKTEAETLHKFRLEFFKSMYEANFHRIDKAIVDFIRESKEFSSFKQLYKWYKINEKHPVLTFACNDEDIQLLVLHGADGSESHAICVVAKYIFDSNCNNALELNEVSLNACCNDCNFEYVARGYHFKKLR